MWRALRQLWMRRIDDPTMVDAVLRHPAFRDRAVLERALSGWFFAPFVHQEMLSGAAFERRARWSRLALAGMNDEHVRRVGERAVAAAVDAGIYPSLLALVRRAVVRATVQLALGDDRLVPLVDRVVADIDATIKMSGGGDVAARIQLAEELQRLLAQPETWPSTSYLGAAKEEALALSVAERVDHVAAVFLATGSIQVSDTVTHALIALAQHPAAQSASDEAALRETLRLFPVNASITRQASVDGSIAGWRFRAGEAVTIYPSDLGEAGSFDPLRQHDERWSFGVGPRACPARRLSLVLASSILGGCRALGVRIEPNYVHRRSLAFPTRARVGAGPAPEPASRSDRAKALLRYLSACAESYPRAFVAGAPELARTLWG